MFIQLEDGTEIEIWVVLVVQLIALCHSIDLKGQHNKSSSCLKATVAQAASPLSLSLLILINPILVRRNATKISFICQN